MYLPQINFLNDQYGNLLVTYSLQTGMEQPVLKECMLYTEAKIDIHSDKSCYGNVEPSEKVKQCQKLVARHEGKRTRGYQTHRRRKRSAEDITDNIVFKFKTDLYTLKI